MNSYIQVLCICSAILIGGCQSTSTRSAAPVNFGAQVSRINGSEYRLTFNGSSSTSLEEARAEWNEEAESLCDSGTAERVITRSELDTYSTTVNTAGVDVGDTGAVTMCMVGGLLGCSLAVLLASPGTETVEREYPVIEGTVICSD